MKKISKYILIILVVLYSSACDSNFDELNTNKVSATSIDPAFQLNAAIVGCAYPNGSLVYDMGVVQQIVTPNSGLVSGANYNQDNRTLTQELWQGYYRNVIKNTRDVIVRLEEDQTRSNLMQMTRIIQAFAFMVLTDDYGSIPYFEGGKGYSDQIYLPVYDSQEAIYTDLIKELTEATAGLNVSGTLETADVLYNGDVEKWRSFGYSLLLRAGMRLSKVDPNRAAQVVQAAVQGGVILNNSDNAAIRHDPNYTNPIGNFLNATEASNFYLTEPFVNYLKNTNDPRLSAIAVTYVGAKSGPEQIPENETYDADVHIGIPMGNDNAGAVKAASDLGLVSFYEFAQADRRRVTKNTAPNFLVTASQNYLLMAEARERGWINTGTVEEYYTAGVRAHMNQLGTIDEASDIAASEVNQYLEENPFDPSNALEQINTQYWVSSFLNGPEAFANFRRSGYPDLLPNPYPGREVEFINRLTYPNSEISVNSENVSAAISAQGPDNLATKVWWDK
ncbi:SusD/RagB family nutrient-binding outer membrane lipoprotein [Algoriphagus sp. AGSA1]|uniref:SusD/RagB family nutrient-binding outer membrane lipoprotein n=1 Tax=Algoriphagus sp. AGSA1 TaxID=2907213 RepID=UPI001F2D5545|nr:SusD/RagB family nutrient-binding outer membrane lipoprotein [Algoriphagus sp. AGSA1]MCE7053341.1 SusD/RagB family nutrient-binding outer membrane lipoprotein [Algoriphagus sp. AGSA1]